MKFNQLYQALFESTNRDLLIKDYDGNRVIYGVHLYFEGLDPDTVENMISDLVRIDSNELLPLNPQGNSPWDADLVENQWGYEFYSFNNFNDAAKGLRNFVEEILKLTDDYYAHRPEAKHVTLPDAETLTNKILDKFKHLRDTPGVWKISAFSEHDIQVFGIEVDIGHIRSQDINNSLQDVDTTGFEDLL